jgi:hypothetical protein
MAYIVGYQKNAIGNGLLSRAIWEGFDKTLSIWAGMIKVAQRFMTTEI